MTYDANGNIKTLKRNQRQHGWVGDEAFYTGEPIDDLAYTYGTGNKVTNITDATGITDGFKQPSSYSYDAAGNTIADGNNDITAITYNVLGKVQEVTLSGNRSLQYTYDGSGNKLTMKLYENSALKTKTDYVNGFIYENGSLSFFATPEGRVVKTASGQLEYQYSIQDHQGNTRLLITSKPVTATTKTATFEDLVVDDENFDNLPTSSHYWVSSIPANHTDPGSKVIRMNKDYKVGPSRSIKVYPGDKVSLEVWSYFESQSGYGTAGIDLNTLIASVAGAFGGVPGAPGEAGAIYDVLDEAVGFMGPAGNRGDALPAAYLNYILLDKNFKLIDFGYRSPSTANTRERLFFEPFQVEEAGYLYVYLSYENDSQNWVSFDDLSVTHTPTPVIQYNEYYPFGLQASTSWTRDGNSNNFLCKSVE